MIFTCVKCTDIACIWLNTVSETCAMFTTQRLEIASKLNQIVYNCMCCFVNESNCGSKFDASLCFFFLIIGQHLCPKSLPAVIVIHCLLQEIRDSAQHACKYVWYFRGTRVENDWANNHNSYTCVYVWWAIKRTHRGIGTKFRKCSRCGEWNETRMVRCALFLSILWTWLFPI